MVEKIESNVVGNRSLLFFVEGKELKAYSRYTLKDIFNLGKVTVDTDTKLTIADNSLLVIKKLSNPFKVSFFQLKDLPTF